VIGESLKLSGASATP